MKLSKDEQEKVIARAKANRKLAYEADMHNRKEMLDDLRFSNLDQWPEDARNERGKRPILTLDKTNQLIKRQVGDMQENRPSIKVLPVDSASDKDTAEIFEGLINQIEEQSSAIHVYINAAKSQLKCGYGVWRVVNEFASHDVFEQNVRLKPVKNPLNWWFDPNAAEPTKHDGNFCIGFETESKESYEKNGGTIPADFDEKFTGEGGGDWIENGAIVVAEYYEKKPVKKTLALLSNGHTVEIDKITEEDKVILAQNGVQVLKERVADSWEIHYYKLSAMEVLEHEMLPFRYFPAIPVYGEMDNIEGKEYVRGLVRPAKDAQRLYNYWMSAAAETIALQPKSPYIGTAKQIAKYKRMWEEANTSNRAVLIYEADAQAPGPPQRQQPPTPQSGFLQQAQFAQEDIKNAMGIHDASVGAESNEISGVAIATRNQNAELTNSIYMFNLQLAIEHTGRVLIDMIPHIYDTQRIIRLIGEDGQEKDVEINRAMMGPQGKTIINDLTRGKYDVRTSVGPSYKTRRIEGAQTLLEMIRVFPQLQQIAGDLLAKNLDIPGAQELEARFRKILPPGMVEEDDPQVLQMQQQQAKIQEMQLQLELALKQAEIQEKEAQAKENLAGAALDMAKAQNEELTTEGSLNQQQIAAIQNLLSIVNTQNQQPQPEQGVING